MVSQGCMPKIWRLHQAQWGFCSLWSGWISKKSVVTTFDQWRVQHILKLLPWLYHRSLWWMKALNFCANFISCCFLRFGSSIFLQCCLFRGSIFLLLCRIFLWWWFLGIHILLFWDRYLHGCVVLIGCSSLLLCINADLLEFWRQLVQILDLGEVSRINTSLQPR